MNQTLEYPKMPFSAEIDSRLDAWGRVVAHRAAVLAQATFRPPDNTKFKIAAPETKLNPGGYRLAAVFGWRWTESCQEVPSIVTEERGPRRGSPSNPSELLLAHAEVCTWLPSSLLSAEIREQRIAGPLIDQLATWLYAVPHYTGPATTTIEEFCRRRLKGDRGRNYEAYTIATYHQWRAWYLGILKNVSVQVQNP